MNINIDSQDLLDILLEAGIQTVDAKALILDILTLQENSTKKPERPSKPPVEYSNPQPRIKPIDTRPSRPAESQAVYGDVVSEEGDSPIASFEDDEEKKPTVTRVQGKSVGARPKFDGFGGDSTGALRR